MLPRLVTFLGVLHSSRVRLLLGVALAIVIAARLLIPLLSLGATADPALTLPPVTADQAAATRVALAIHVDGNRFVTQDGRSVILHGVTRDGSDFLCTEGKGFFDGPTGPASIAALLNWHINAVRIPLNEACWLGMPGIPAQDGGVAYQSAIAAYVQALTGRGVYVILDLHKNAPGAQIDVHAAMSMPDADHSVTFWQQVASQFKGNGMVLFDLFNEPNRIDWHCWRDGGTCAGIPYPTVGMQTLVQAVRATGAANVLLVAGMRWANDLSQWQTYAPVDPLHNLAASWHVYIRYNQCNTIACWEQTVAPIAARVPVVVGEFGTDPTGSACSQDLMNGVATLLGWLDREGASYMAFSWNVGQQACSSLSLISDYAGTPHDPNGAAYRAHLLALAAASPSTPTPPRDR